LPFFDPIGMASFPGADSPDEQRSAPFYTFRVCLRPAASN